MPRRASDHAHIGSRCLRRAIGMAAGLLLLSVVRASAQPVAEPLLYRIFLKAGAAVVSWGEFAKVGDRVAFSVPLGDPLKPDKLQFVSLPADVIDWERTNQYADSVRYKRYAAVRGEADYKALTDEMARALMAIAFSRDSVARLAAAEEARRRLVEWPAQHYGYRAADVRDLASTVEETIAGIRADAGERHFQINLVATLEPPSALLMNTPTPQESVELAAAVARVSDVKADRMSLQTAILATLAAGRSTLPAAWATATGRRLKADERNAARDDRRYTDLVANAARDAEAGAARADVTSVQRVLADVRKQDERFGRRRPAEIRSLVASVETQLELARQRRLEVDRWRFRDETYRSYRSTIGQCLDRIASVAEAAEAIRSMSGPDVQVLNRTERQLSETAALLQPLVPPDDLRPSHDALASAVRFMLTAVNVRRTAVIRTDIEAARNASAAAAGALMLVERAREEILAYFKRPTFR